MNETFNKLQTRVKNRNYRKQSSDLSNNDDVSSQETNKSNEEKNVEASVESKRPKDQEDQNSSTESDQDIGKWNKLFYLSYTFNSYIPLLQQITYKNS